MAGAAGAETVNPFLSVAPPPPVAALVTNTSRGPVVAPAATASLAVSVVVFVTASWLTVIPAPKSTVVPEPNFEPVTVTATFACPWTAIAGVTAEMVGVATLGGRGRGGLSTGSDDAITLTDAR